MTTINVLTHLMPGGNKKLTKLKQTYKSAVERCVTFLLPPGTKVKHTPALKLKSLQPF